MNREQPRALYLLFAVKMWECFSFYGMRALLVLYVIDQLGMDELRAYGTYAIYGGLVEFSGLVGGFYADRIFGLRKSIVYGGWLIAAGHMCLSLQAHPWFFFSGLALIVVGTGLFSSNISALLGLFYGEEDPRREAGYTLFYVGINIGALLASLTCGVIGELYGWHYGFGLAAVGMTAGNILFFCYRNVLEGKGELMQKRGQTREKMVGSLLLLVAFLTCAIMIVWENIFMQIMPLLCLFGLFYIGRKMATTGSFPKEKLIKLGLYLAVFALFFAAEDQTASALLVFSERFATDTIAGFRLPATALLSLNPFVIIVGGAIMSRLNRDNKNVLRFVFAGLFLASAVFLFLTLACNFPNSEGLVPLEIVAATIFVASVGEVLLAPAVFSYFSEAAPKEWQGVTMGLLPLGFSLGNVMSGFLSKSMVVAESAAANSLKAYGEGFGLISLLLGVAAVTILFGQPFVDKLFNREAVS